jgi:hypothetical protein
LRQFFGTNEPTAIESYNVYAPLIIDDVRVVGGRSAAEEPLVSMAKQKR